LLAELLLTTILKAYYLIYYINICSLAPGTSKNNINHGAFMHRGGIMASIFTKIINGEIGATKIYEDDKCISILDINPNNKGHALVIPRFECETVLDCPEDILGHLINVAKKVAEKQMDALNCDGVNISINNKKAAGQEVSHLHIHVIPRYFKDRYKLGFGHVDYAPGEIDDYGKKLKLG